MAGIQLSGLASGLDTATIIDQLMSVERAPRTKLTMKQAAIQARENVLKTLTTKLGTLKDATGALADAAKWSPVQSVDSSDPTKVSARQLSGSGPGSYQLAVSQLATSDQHTYAYTPPAGADTLQIGSASIAVAANATIDDVVSSINASTTAGVFAVNVGGSLVLAAKQTGTANAFTATGASVSEQAAKARPAQDAKYTIDNGTVQTSSSNVVANAIPGVELTLKGPTTGTTINVGNPGVDKAALGETVKQFIDAYNSAMTYMRTVTTEQPVAHPTTASDAGKGSLYGDTALGSIMDSMRRTVSQAFTGVGNGTGTQLLSQLGISTGASTGGAAFNPDAVAGKLTFDEKAFDAALDADPQGVQRLLGAATGVSGFSQALQDKLTPYTQTGGLLATRVTSADDDLRGLADQLSAFDSRMTLRETFLRNQFTALETSLQKINAQGADLAARLGLNKTN
jgi:flagellar hook-associated protein 2